MSIVWLLDIDGVLNALRRPAWPGEFSEGRAMGFRIRWSPECGAEILRIREQYGVDVRWCTTWAQPVRRGCLDDPLCVRHIEKLLGWPELPHVLFTDRTSKYRAAQDVLNTGDSLIWTDDEAIPDEFMHSHRDQQRALCLAPDPNLGLTREHLHMVEAWCTPRVPVSPDSLVLAVP